MIQVGSNPYIFLGLSVRNIVDLSTDCQLDPTPTSLLSLPLVHWAHGPSPHFGKPRVDVEGVRLQHSLVLTQFW